MSGRRSNPADWSPQADQIIIPSAKWTDSCDSFESVSLFPLQGFEQFGSLVRKIKGCSSLVDTQTHTAVGRHGVGGPV